MKVGADDEEDWWGPLSTKILMMMSDDGVLKIQIPQQSITDGDEDKLLKCNLNFNKSRRRRRHRIVGNKTQVLKLN